MMASNTLGLFIEEDSLIIENNNVNWTFLQNITVDNMTYTNTSVAFEDINMSLTTDGDNALIGVSILESVSNNLFYINYPAGSSILWDISKDGVQYYLVYKNVSFLTPQTVISLGNNIYWSFSGGEVDPIPPISTGKNKGLNTIEDNVGIQFEDIILMIVFLAGLIVFALDFKTGIAIEFLTFGITFVLFYFNGDEYMKALIGMFIWLIILALTLLPISKYEKQGVV